MLKRLMTRRVLLRPPNILRTGLLFNVSFLSASIAALDWAELERQGFGIAAAQHFTLLLPFSFVLATISLLALYEEE